MAFGKLSVDELISSNNISVTGNVSFTGNVTVGAGTASNAAISTSGDPNTGIFFPAADNIGFATNGVIRGRWTTDGLCFGSDTAAANALDDYEEGTWTPVIAPTSGSLTAYTASGTYTKIGRSVNLTFSVSITTPGTASGKMNISGFPFTNGNGYQTPTLCREQVNTGTAYQAFINASNTTGHVRTLTEGDISWTTSNQYVFFMTYVA